MTRARDVASQGGLVLLNTTTISGAATTNIDGVFTSAYENYMLVLNCTAAGDTEILTKLRANGTTNTNYHEWWGWYQGSGTPWTAISSSTATSWNWAYAYASNEQSTSAIATITAPQVATRRAAWFGQAVRSRSSGGVGTIINGGHVVTGSFDGISIVATANLTGTVRIYGIRN
jgi:hypothetical protein